MDNRQVLINILKDMQKNLRVILRLAQQPIDEPVQDRFYRWIREPFPLTPEEEVPIVSTCDQSLQETVNVVHSFAEVVADQIAKGQTVDGSHTRLTRLRKERERMENRLRQLKISQEQEEVSQKIECQSRVDLIKDLKIRLDQTEERTTSCLRLAKECGEAARKEWEINNQKPLEEQQLHYDLLGAQLNNLLKENAITENQLKKCREERKQEVESVTLKMNTDIRQRQDEVDTLQREVTEESAQLQQVEKNLASVTLKYDAIIERQRKEAEEALKRQAEERLRERAAIKIQRWFRFFLFRTMRARRRRKKSKRKVSKEVRKDPVEEHIKALQQEQARKENQQGEEGERDASGELRTTVAVLGVLVSRKSAVIRKPVGLTKSVSVSPVGQPSTDLMNLDIDLEDELLTPSPDIEYSAPTVNKPKKGKSKKTGSAIHSITVKKNRTDPKAPTIEKEVKPKPITSLNRASQTDNRVPRSKQTFR